MSNIILKDKKKRIDLAQRFRQCLLSNRQYNKAKTPFLEVMQRYKRVLGQENPSILTSISNLALTFQNQGHQKEAEDLDV